MTLDSLGRPLRDLRISLTDRCNFRCRYCMPAELFGPGYAFLPDESLLGNEEIARLVRVVLPLGLKKVRLTGGEPLLRRDIAELVAILASYEAIEDLALTTNGVLLAHQAEALSLAGLHRVTVSMDAIDETIFAKMNGVSAKVDRVMAGIHAALMHGLKVKINSVIQRGVNESQILPLLQWAGPLGIPVRFIEYMDVGESNQWQLPEVVPAEEILSIIRAVSPVTALPATAVGEVARRYQAAAWSSEFGVISSVTKPFCRDCNRARLSADGKLFTCLFTAKHTDLRTVLREGADDAKVADVVRATWQKRDDRYSELRGKAVVKKAEMSYLGG
jgi:GTP 3',8-cyclase